MKYTYTQDEHLEIATQLALGDTAILYKDIYPYVNAGCLILEHTKQKINSLYKNSVSKGDRDRVFRGINEGNVLLNKIELYEKTKGL